MFRWFRRTFLGLTPGEKKVKKLRKGSTFKYKGRGYRVRGNGRAYVIDGDDTDFLDLLFLLDIAADGVLDFNFGWTPESDNWDSAPESIIQERMFGDESTITEPDPEEPKAEVESKDEFELEQIMERPDFPEPGPTPAPSYTPDPEPSRSFSSGYDSGGSSSYDSGGSSSYDSGGGGDCGGGGGGD